MQKTTKWGEYHVPKTRFYVDGYDKNKNVVIEFYKKHHKSEIKVERDILRKNKIIEVLNCDFLIIKEWELNQIFSDEFINEININFNKK